MVNKSKQLQENNKSRPIYVDYIKTIYDSLKHTISHTYTHNNKKEKYMY